MNILLNHTRTTTIVGRITISGSKSESNRLLILQKLYPSLQIENLSNSDDTKHLQKALQSKSETIDIGHAGTAMRFLTAYYAIQPNREVVLTGSKRMRERPIRLLVSALKQLGSSITYLNNEGFPPIKIFGKELIKNKVTIQANVSSQYISALLLIAPKLKKGLVLRLEGEITSMPYIEMTLSLIKSIGITNIFSNNTISISPKKILINPEKITVEPDWSSASYYYSLASLQKNSKIELAGFKENSLQGDSLLPTIYNKLGVTTRFSKNGIILQSTPNFTPKNTLSFNLNKTPDLAQTIIVSCLGLGVDCFLTGLHTLAIKETNRLEALKNELEKLGASISLTNDSIKMEAPKILKRHVSINTYQDHRMAMAFAPLSVLVPISVENSEVVSKSYPKFWDDWESLFS